MKTSAFRAYDVGGDPMAVLEVEGTPDGLRFLGEALSAVSVCSLPRSESRVGDVLASVGVCLGWPNHRLEITFNASARTLEDALTAAVGEFNYFVRRESGK